MTGIDEVLNIIKRGSIELIVENELKERLREDKPLRVKLGFDPTAPDIHLGHTVALHKLSQFQELGHQIVLLIGDFTAMIGDPSGKSATRKQLSKEEVLLNAQTYQDQVFKILDKNKTEVRFNSEWLGKLQSADIIRLAATYTVARMLERDDFKSRYQNEQPIAIHEFLYPLLQGYDSVAIRADIELGGTDQKFNLLVGRELQKHFGQRPQCVLTMPLLEGLDGVQKMSKSLGNYIGIAEPADEIFGKVMSISDDLMWKYFELLSASPSTEINQWREEASQGSRNPRDLKILLATELVARFQGQTAAQSAHENFISRFRHHEIPENIEEKTVHTLENYMGIAHILKQSGLVSSTSEGLRMVEQGAVRMDGQRIEDKQLQISAGKTHIVQVGKRRFAKIKVVKG